MHLGVQCMIGKKKILMIIQGSDVIYRYIYFCIFKLNVMGLTCLIIRVMVIPVEVFGQPPKLRKLNRPYWKLLVAGRY